MNKEEYQKYLKSEHWSKKKKELFFENRYRCLGCGSRMKLEVHHLTYKNIGNESLQDLVYLCRYCHNKVTFSEEKEKFTLYLLEKRKRNFFAVPKNRNKKRKRLTKYLQNEAIRKQQWRVKYRGMFKKRQPMKNYAGLFTWKAEEIRKQKENA